MRGNHLFATFIFLEPKNSISKTKILDLISEGSRQPQELEERKKIILKLFFIYLCKFRLGLS